MKCLIFILLCLLLIGCETTTPRPTKEVRHLSWSGKTLATQNVSVDMNRHGLLVLTVDGVEVADRVNWCVEIVEWVQP